MVTMAMSAILAYSGPGRRRPGSIPGDTWSSRAGELRRGPEVQPLSNVLLLTSGREPPADILPSLSLLPHTVRVAPATAEHVVTGPVPDAVLVDARRDLVQAKRVLLALRVAATSVPVIAIVTDGGWAAVSADWGADDLLLHTAGPAEVEARLRLAIGRRTQAAAQL